VNETETERRASERAERRRTDRRQSQISIFIERRFGERRRVPRRLIDVFRSFLGLAPLDD
jgi:capsule polysaccharide export protein KpsE/RkpR